MVLLSHRILIVEDEIFIGLELEQVMRDTGADVVGPAVSVPEALRLIESHAITAAVLDLQLGKQDSIPVAQRLTEAGIPFIFQTGIPDISALAKDWPGVPILRKLAPPEKLVAAVLAVVDTAPVVGRA